MSLQTHNERVDDARKTHDIYHIVFLLQQKVVRDLVPAIFEYAGVYTTTTAYRQFVPTLKTTRQYAPRKLLVCGPIRSKARILRPVREITFKIAAHDQGFANSPDGGPWIWYTARILDSKATKPNDIKRDESVAAVDPHREICRNLAVNRKWEYHDVTWRSGSSDSDEAAWVSGLAVGDCIAVYAWSQFPAWVNHVRNISITVRAAAVV